MTSRARVARRGTDAARRDIASFRALYRKFRSFDRPNLVPLFPGFRPSPGFAREFPESVQSGPLWPWPKAPRYRGRRSGVERHVVWYAGPSSSERIAGRLLDGLEATRLAVRLTVRSARPLPIASRGTVRVETVGSLSPRHWTAVWRSADLVIVSGSRSLLEAIDRGVPFLYFNGVLGVGRRTRRHRPEKIAGLLPWLRAEHAPLEVRRGLAAFARAHRVAEVSRDALLRPAWRSWSPRRTRSSGYPEGFGDAGEVAVTLARRLAAAASGASEVVAWARRASRHRGSDAAGSKA